MEMKRRDIVYGYVKNNYDGLCPKEIIEVIYSFYLIVIESKILSRDEEFSLFNLLTNEFQKSDKKIMNISLLFRASEHDFSADMFHQFCDDKGPTLVIVQNDRDYIFGGFTNCSWKRDRSKRKNKNDLLFTLRPNAKLFGINEDSNFTDIVGTIWRYPFWGPLFGDGHDFWICNKCNETKNSGCRAHTFNITEKEFCGYEIGNDFIVKDYEVFSITIEFNL